jgi:choline dehydrogenase-like flavoprotein
MEHPHYTSGLWQPFDGSLLTDRRVWDIRGRTFPVQDKYRLSDEVVEREGLPQVVFRLQPGVVTARLAAARDQRPSRRSRRAARELVDALVAHRRPAEPAAVVATLLAEAPRLGAWGLHLAADELLRRGGRQAPTVFRMRAMGEQVPDPDSRVLLGSDRDALGMPRARLDWRLNRADLEGLHRAQLRMKAAMERAGLGRVYPLTDGVSLPPALGGGFHHMGTARMADDPRQGVVDRNCRVHDLDNLYVAGSAVFPTGGYVNPTLTIVALASRLGRHLAAM